MGYMSVKTVKDLVCFCNSHKNLYIYGCGAFAEKLNEYLQKFGLSILGYAVTDTSVATPNNSLPLFTLDKISGESIGFILGLNDLHYNDVICNLHHHGFNDFFIIRESDKSEILRKLTVRNTTNLNFKISLVDHCNLKCAYCDHFSQVASESFVDISEFESDMKRLSLLCDGMLSSQITLIGGEPLLHPEIEKFCEITRKSFKYAIITILTNGILLEGMPKSFWYACRMFNIDISVTPYPVKVNVNKIAEIAIENGVNFSIRKDNYDDIHGEKLIGIFPIITEGHAETAYFVACCYFNECLALRHGLFYSCHVASNAHIFNNAFNQHLEISDSDSVDIYRVKTFEELCNRLTTPPQYCRYCDVKNRRIVGKWGPSTRSIDEYVD